MNNNEADEEVIAGSCDLHVMVIHVLYTQLQLTI